MPDIRLEPITKDNFRAVGKLQVKEEQFYFIANNIFSIAQAYVYPNAEPLAIYADDQLVGFTLLEREADTGYDWIVRFMIDAQQQGKGYGRAALEAIIDYMRQKPDVQQIRLSYVPQNTHAEQLYRKVGFEPTGELDDTEIVMKLAS